jgi:hypothetical protein
VTTIVVVRMRTPGPTRAYVARRRREGRITKEIMRTLRRCVLHNPLPKWPRADSAVVRRTRFLHRTLWHADTIRGMIRIWMPHWCWASKAGW